MKIHEFNTHFPDEYSCRIHYKKVREQKGVTCKKCKGTAHYWLSSKWQWQCKRCDFRTTLRSGTVIQYSNLPFYKWYLCMALMSATKKGISAKEMQRQLGHKRYRTVWTLMQKVRAGMGEMDNPIHLDAEIKIKFCNETFKAGSGKSSNLKFTLMDSNHYDLEAEKHMNGEPSDFNDNGKITWLGEKKAKNSGFSRYFNTFMTFTNQDRWDNQSYAWMDIIRSNAKRAILGVYHKVSTRFLQNYLSEFCFRLNRRQLDEKRFDSLILAITQKYCGTIATIQV